ncbi:MAG: hypothetical protein FWD68_08445 [Alphaproteobacteria bacterium]|nr:hypothetical protein [Alphaproteobacteria bacterium]
MAAALILCCFPGRCLLLAAPLSSRQGLTLSFLAAPGVRESQTNLPAPRPFSWFVADSDDFRCVGGRRHAPWMWLRGVRGNTAKSWQWNMPSPALSELEASPQARTWTPCQDRKTKSQRAKSAPSAPLFPFSFFLRPKLVRSGADIGPAADDAGNDRIAAGGVAEHCSSIHVGSAMVGSCVQCTLMVSSMREKSIMNSALRQEEGSM